MEGNIIQEMQVRKGRKRHANFPDSSAQNQDIWQGIKIQIPTVQKKKDSKSKGKNNFSFEVKNMKHVSNGNQTISPDCSSTVSAIKGMTSNPTSIREQSNMFQQAEHKDPSNELTEEPMEIGMGQAMQNIPTAENYTIIVQQPEFMRPQTQMPVRMPHRRNHTISAEEMIAKRRLQQNCDSRSFSALQQMATLRNKIITKPQTQQNGYEKYLEKQSIRQSMDYVQLTSNLEQHIKNDIYASRKLRLQQKNIAPKLKFDPTSFQKLVQDKVEPTYETNNKIEQYLAFRQYQSNFTNFVNRPISPQDIKMPDRYMQVEHYDKALKHQSHTSIDPNIEWKSEIGAENFHPINTMDFTSTQIHSSQRGINEVKSSMNQMMPPTSQNTDSNLFPYDVMSGPSLRNSHQLQKVKHRNRTQMNLTLQARANSRSSAMRLSGTTNQNNEGKKSLLQHFQDQGLMSTMPGRPVTGKLRPHQMRALSSYGASTKNKKTGPKIPKFLHLDDNGRVKSSKPGSPEKPLMPQKITLLSSQVGKELSSAAASQEILEQDQANMERGPSRSRQQTSPSRMHPQSTDIRKDKNSRSPSHLRASQPSVESRSKSAKRGQQNVHQKVSKFTAQTKDPKKSASVRVKKVVTSPKPNQDLRATASIGKQDSIQSITRQPQMRRSSIDEPQYHQSLDSFAEPIKEEVSTTGSDIYRVNVSTAQANRQLAMSTKALRQLENETYDKHMIAFEKTKLNSKLITNAQENIKRLNSKLRHHVLSSEYNAEREPDPNSKTSKYIDVEADAPVPIDVQILGNSQEMFKPKGSKQKPQPRFEAVPILFRVKDCKPDEFYQITIKQVSKEQLDAIKFPRKAKGALLMTMESFLRKEVKRQASVTSADLQIYISNTCGHPTEQRHEKSYYHNNIKNKSKITQLTFFNKRVENLFGGDGKNSIIDANDEVSEGDEAGDAFVSPNGNDIFISIFSKMGTWVRISVKNIETAKENNKTNSKRKDKNLGYGEIEQIEEDLQDYYADNAHLVEPEHKFDAINEHISTISQNLSYRSDQRSLIQEKFYIRSILKDMADKKRSMLTRENRKEVLKLNFRWEQYKIDREREKERLCIMVKNQYRIKTFLKWMQLSKIKKQVEAGLQSLRVQNMFKNSCLFISMKMFMLHIRRKRRYGREIGTRMLRFYIRPTFNLVAVTKYTTLYRKSRVFIKMILEDFASQDLLNFKLRKFYTNILVIQKYRTFTNMGRILRFIFCYDAFERERQFITSFYEKKTKNQSGRFIVQKMAKIMEKTINDVIVLYLLSKKMDYMISFYEEKVEYFQSRIKYSETLRNGLIEIAKDKFRMQSRKKKASKQGKLSRKPTKGSDLVTPQSNVMTPIGSDLTDQDQYSGLISDEVLGVMDQHQRMQFDSYCTTIRKDSNQLKDYERKAAKNKKEKAAIEFYLFSKTDDYIKADGSVQKSFEKSHQILEKKYKGREIKGKVVQNIDYSSMHAEFRDNNTNENDVYGDSSQPKGDQSHPDAHQGYQGVQKFKDTTTIKPGGNTGTTTPQDQDKKKRGPFNLQAPREDIHRMIFKCTSLDNQTSIDIWMQLGKSPEQRQEIINSIWQSYCDFKEINKKF